MRTTPILIIVGLTAGLAGCGSAPVEQPDQSHAARGTGYLEGGPTVAIDSKPMKNTTLEMLDTRIKENARLKARIETAAAARAEAEGRASQAAETSAAQSRRVDELERLLARQAEENRELMDELLKARIMRLRMERELLQSKLADLAAEKQ